MAFPVKCSGNFFHCVNDTFQYAKDCGVDFLILADLRLGRVLRFDIQTFSNLF